MLDPSGQSPADPLAMLLQLLQGGTVAPQAPQIGPGQTAGQGPQLPGPPQSPVGPDARIAGAFEDAAGADPRPQLRFERTQNDPQTTGSVFADDGRPQLPGKLGGIRNFADDVFAGVGGDPSRDPVSAFAQGWSGSAGARAKREDRDLLRDWAKEDRALKMDDRSYERGRDAKGDARLDRAEQRAARQDQFGNLLTAARIEALQKKSSKSGLSQASVRDVERLTTDYMVRRLGMNEPDYPGKYDKERRAADEKLVEKFHQDMIDSLKNASDSGEDTEAESAAEDAAEGGEGAETGAPAAAAAPSGDGTQEAPFTGIATPEDFKALPSGAYLVGPDGKLFRKK